MITERIYCPRVLIISGSGKNAGKTTLINALIHSLKPAYQVVAIKISPHFHPVRYNNFIFECAGKYSIYEELSVLPENDSSKMKQAGASRVFYIQSKDQYVGEAFLKCLEYVDDLFPVICESGSLDQMITPGLMIYIRNGEKELKMDAYERISMMIDRDRDHFKSVVDKISFQSGTWGYQNHKG